VSTARHRVALIGDALFFAFLAIAFLISVTGGVRVGRSWYRFSATDPTNTVLLAFGIAAVRHLVVRQPSLRARLTARRLARQPHAPATLHRGPTPREWLVAAVLMAGATALLLQDQVAMITGVRDRGDPMFSMWRVAWVAHQLVTDPLHLFDANLFHPATNTFAYSDAMVLPGLLSAPVLWAGAPVAIVHGVLYLASFFVAGLSMFWLAKRVTGLAGPALVAGVLFAFYPYRFATYSHLEMQGIFLMPAALLFLLRLLETGSLRDGVLLGLSVTAQTLWSLYLGAYLAIGLIVVLFGRWLGGHFALRDRLRPLVAAAVVAAAALVPYSLPYWSARQTLGDRPRGETYGFSARPLDFVTSNEASRLYGEVLHRPIVSERQLFPGMTMPVLAAVAIIPPVAPLASVACAGMLVAADAALGLNGATFTWLYERFPPFRAFRVPARFAMVLGLFMSLVAGIGAARLIRRWPRTPAPHIITAGLLGLSLFELRPTLALTPTLTSPPPVYAALPAGRVVLVDVPLPAEDGEYWIDPTYLYYSTFHWKPLINGYSGFTPVWYARLMVASREFPSDESLAVFRERGAQYLVLHEEFYPTEKYREIAQALDRRADLRLIDAQRSAAGECRLYQVLRDGVARGTSR
jgi:hypothetical protein